MGRTVGKMERRRETRKSHAGSNSLCDANDDAIPRQQNQQSSRYSHSSSCSFSNIRYTSNNNMISPSSFGEKNSLEDGSQGSKISGLEHQLSSMEKRERNSSATPSSFKSISDDAADDDATFTTVAGCLSCNRQRRDDYGGNDFGECLHHQLYQKQEQQKKKICKRQVAMVVADSAFLSPLQTTPFNSTYDAPTGEIDTTAPVTSSDCLLQHHHPTHQHHQHHYQNTTSSVCLSSMSGNTSQDGKTCRQHEQRQQYFFSGLSRAIWIHLGMLSLLSLNLQGKNS